MWIIDTKNPACAGFLNEEFFMTTATTVYYFFSLGVNFT